MHTNEEEQKRERERSDITYDAVVLTFLFFLFFFFFDEGRLLELSSSGFLFLLLKNTNVVTKLLKPLNQLCYMDFASTQLICYLSVYIKSKLKAIYYFLSQTKLRFSHSLYYLNVQNILLSITNKITNIVLELSFSGFLFLSFFAVKKHKRCY